MCTSLLCVAFALAAPVFPPDPPLPNAKATVPPVKATPVIVVPEKLPLPMPGSFPGLRASQPDPFVPVRAVVSNLRHRSHLALLRMRHGRA